MYDYIAYALLAKLIVTLGFFTMFVFLKTPKRIVNLFK